MEHTAERQWNHNRKALSYLPPRRRDVHRRRLCLVPWVRVHWSGRSCRLSHGKAVRFREEERRSFRAQESSLPFLAVPPRRPALIQRLSSQAVLERKKPFPAFLCGLTSAASCCWPGHLGRCPWAAHLKSQQQCHGERQRKAVKGSVATAFATKGRETPRNHHRGNAAKGSERKAGTKQRKSSKSRETGPRCVADSHRHDCRAHALDHLVPPEALVRPAPSCARGGKKAVKCSERLRF